MKKIFLTIIFLIVAIVAIAFFCDKNEVNNQPREKDFSFTVSIPGYKVSEKNVGSFAYADLYNSTRKAPVGTAICGVFQSVEDSKLILAAFNADGTEMMQNGKPIRIAISNIPSHYASLVWDGNEWNAGNLHVSQDYRDGFEYKGLDNPALINFISHPSIILQGNPQNPLKEIAAWQNNGAVINGILFK